MSGQGSTIFLVHNISMINLTKMRKERKKINKQEFSGNLRKNEIDKWTDSVADNGQRNKKDTDIKTYR